MTHYFCDISLRWSAGARKSIGVIAGSAGLVLALAPTCVAQAEHPFPLYLSNNFDYASFTRFDAASPPKELIYQSNGFMALQEKGFGGQVVIVPVVGDPVPTNSSDRLFAAAIDAPTFTDAAGKTYDLGDSLGSPGTPGQRHVTYFADRTVYGAAFTDGPEVSLTVYPVYGKPAAVMRIKIEKASGPTRVSVNTGGMGFQLGSERAAATMAYGSSRWSYRLLIGSPFGAHRRGSSFEWQLSTRGQAAVIIALGENKEKAAAALRDVEASADLFDRATHKAWNDYLASTPLVAPEAPMKFTIGTTNQQETIAPEDLVRSELWFWRGVLTTTCQARYLPGCPLTVADWNVFMGMWGNDGIAESIALASTGRKELARTAILNWFRYSVNAKGDGTAAWTIFPSGRNTFQAAGPERETQSVPVQGSLVGQYVRATGDAGILEEKPGGAAGNRTLWQDLVAYERNLLNVRDPNHDHLIDWLHTYETGWDDKNSPFVDLKGASTSAINEQVFNLWSLEEMVYLSRLRGEDPAPWQREFEEARAAVRSKLWDENTRRYWDLDVNAGTLWTAGENLDAYYVLYYETDQARVAAMMKRLDDPLKFNGALLPTMAFDTPKWGGYWRGPAWPRIFSYVALALDRAGERQKAFEWLARAIRANLGPLLPENVDPKAYPPGEHAIGDVRIMGYDALDTMVFPDVAGLRTWAGEDLTVAPNSAAGKIYIRGQKWMGDSYDAMMEPGRATRLWRNGREGKPLAAEKNWRAEKKGEQVYFKPVK